MARAYSDDLRRKVLEAYASGKGTLGEVARRFDVSYGWVAKVHRMEQQTGSWRRPGQSRHGRVSKVDPAQVLELVRRQPDIVLRELQQQMAESGLRVGTTRLWAVLRQLGLRLKKSRSTLPSATPNRTAGAGKSSSRSSARRGRKT